MQRGSRIPYIASSGTRNNGRINPRITCFNCGLHCYYSDMCTNSPVSTYKQKQIREPLRSKREQSAADYCASERHHDSPLWGPNAMEVTPPTIQHRPVIEQTVKTSVSMPMVACIPSWKVSNSELEKACIVASQIPAVGTIFANAMAEKPAGVEDGDSESVTGWRAAKALRRFRELSDKSRPSRWLRSTNNPLAYGRSSELDPLVEEEVSRAPSNVVIESPIEIAGN